METEENIDDINGQKPQKGCGEILAEERKKQNRTIEDVSETLNLSVSQLKAIEQDITEGLPEPTYVRGYIRAYATLLDLDPDQVLGHYQNDNWTNSTSLNGLPRGINNESLQSGGNFSVWIRGLIIASLLALIAYFWLSGSVGDLFSDKPQAVQNSTLATAEVNNQGLTEGSSETGKLDEASESVELLSEVSASESGGLEEAALVDSADDAADIVKKNNLILNFSDTSWIDIRDEADKRLAYKSYVEGDELIVSSDLPVSVFIGNAAGVKVKYNNEDFDISEHQEGVYAKFIVGE